MWRKRSDVIFCWLVLSSLQCSVHSIEPVTMTLLATAAGSAGALIGGTSSTIFGDSTLIEVEIVVENWTRFHMTDPTVSFEDGVGRTFPKSIVPGGNSTFNVRKSRNAALGSFGSASWRIHYRSAPNIRPVVMWSVPYNYLHYSNRLAVGIILSRTHNQGWTDKMYYGNENWFNKADYDTVVRYVMYDDVDVQIRGAMGTGHDAKVHILVLPQRDEDLADSLKRKVPKWIQTDAPFQ